VYVCKWLVESICIRLIHFRTIERQQVKNHFLMHVGYLETWQHCVSLLPRSLSFRSSLSTLPTQEQQLCVGKPSPLSIRTIPTQSGNEATTVAPHYYSHLSAKNLWL